MQPEPSSSGLRRLLAERGFSTVDGLVIAAVALAGLVAFLFVALPRLSAAPTGEAAARAVAEREVQRMAAKPWEALLMTGAPEPATDPSSPLSRVGEGSPPAFASPGGDTEQLALAEDPDKRSDYVSTTPGEWDGDSAWGKVHRFVTWSDGRKAKRITVAVTVDSPGGHSKPIYMSAEVKDPQGGTSGAPGKSGEATPGEPVTANPGGLLTVYGYDTPVSAGERRQPAADHPLHDTTLVPDLLGTDSIPNPFPPPQTPPKLNYSSDLGKDVAGGRLLNGSDGCKGGSRSQVQRWVRPADSPPVKLEGGASATVWVQATKSGGGGKLCVRVLDVSLTENGGVHSSRVIGSASKDVGRWPAQPANVRVDYDVPEHELGAGHSLGVEVSVSGAGVGLLYDHPDAATLFQFTTAAPAD